MWKSFSWKDGIKIAMCSKKLLYSPYHSVHDYSLVSCWICFVKYGGVLWSRMPNKFHEALRFERFWGGKWVLLTHTFQKFGSTRGNGQPCMFPLPILLGRGRGRRYIIILNAVSSAVAGWGEGYVVSRDCCSSAISLTIVYHKAFWTRKVHIESAAFVRSCLKISL